MDLPLRATFSPATHWQIFFTRPYPPIASQPIPLDVPLARARAFQFSIHLFKGVAEAALYCAHRATGNPLINPSKLA
jgi:hypothetical protein